MEYYVGELKVANVLALRSELRSANVSLSIKILGSIKFERMISI